MVVANASLSPSPPHTDSVEDDFELSTVCHRPESMDKLQEQTKFTKKELQVLYRGFKNVGGKTHNRIKARTNVVEVVFFGIKIQCGKALVCRSYGDCIVIYLLDARLELMSFSRLPRSVRAAW